MTDVNIGHREHRHPLSKLLNRYLGFADTDLNKKLRTALCRDKFTCDC